MNKTITIEWEGDWCSTGCAFYGSDDQEDWCTQGWERPTRGRNRSIKHTDECPGPGKYELVKKDD